MSTKTETELIDSAGRRLESAGEAGGWLRGGVGGLECKREPVGTDSVAVFGFVGEPLEQPADAGTGCDPALSRGAVFLLERPDLGELVRAPELVGVRFKLEQEPGDP